MRQPSRRLGTAPESPCALTDSAVPSTTDGAGPHARLTARMSQLTERLQALLLQRLKLTCELTCVEHADTLPCGYDPALRANLIISYVLKRWHHYARSGFYKKPSEHADAQLRLLLQ